MSLSYVEVNPQGDVKAVVIWLHGLGDSGHGFAPIVPELALPDELGIRFVFPHAPVQPVTINGGMRMNAWYDIKSLDMDNRADEQGVIASAGLVKALIDKEIEHGIPAQRIILAGFSQGGVVTLHLATRLPYRLGGIMAMSTYLCRPDCVAPQCRQENLETPFFMAHGRQDDVVPFAAGQQAREVLLNCGFKVQWFDYAMGHSVCIEQLKDIRQFILNTVQNTNTPD